MSNKANMIPIPGRLHSVAEDEPVCGSDEVLYEPEGQTAVPQSELNKRVADKLPASVTNPFNGLGRVVLPMNLVDVEESGTTVQKNVLTQSMINQANTIYVIQYDFTLDTNITVPSNCVLEFDGGSISGNNVIIGQNTGIDAGLVKIFSTDIVIIGGWNVNIIYPEWFGAEASKNGYEVSASIATINTNAIKASMDFSQNCRNHYNSYLFRNMQNICIKFSYGTYFINDFIQIPAGACLHADSLGTVIEQEDQTKDIFVCDLDSYLWGSSGAGAHQCTIKGFSFRGGVTQIKLINNNLGGICKIFECNFYKPSSYAIYADIVSSRLTVKDCRTREVKQFLYVKADSSEVEGLEGGMALTNDASVVDDYAFIVNKSRKLQISNGLITAANFDETGIHVSTANKKARLVDNHQSVTISNFVLDGPGGGIATVYNYAHHTPSNWDNYNNENWDYNWGSVSSYWVSFSSSVIIKDSTLPTSNRDNSVVVLADGVPSITSIENCNMIRGKFISIGENFDLADYLSQHGAHGTIRITILNNNAILDAEPIPQLLEKYSIYNYGSNVEYSHTYISRVNTDMLEGITIPSTVSNDGTTFIFDIPGTSRDLSPALVSFYGITDRNTLLARECRVSLLKVSQDSASIKSVELSDLAYYGNAGQQHTVTLVWVYNNTEYSTCPNVDASLRIKVDGYANLTGYPQTLQCRMLKLVPDYNFL